MLPQCSPHFVLDRHHRDGWLMRFLFLGQSSGRYEAKSYPILREMLGPASSVAPGRWTIRKLCRQTELRRPGLECLVLVHYVIGEIMRRHMSSKPVSRELTPAGTSAHRRLFVQVVSVTGVSRERPGRAGGLPQWDFWPTTTGIRHGSLCLCGEPAFPKRLRHWPSRISATGECRGWVGWITSLVISHWSGRWISHAAIDGCGSRSRRSIPWTSRT